MNLDLEKKAHEIRNSQNIQTYGIKDIFTFAEDLGYDLIRYPFEEENIDGFSTVYEGRKVIVSNSSNILAREIFTIAHEIGHLQYDFNPLKQDIIVDENRVENNDPVEKRADFFAGTLLMPKSKLEEFVQLVLEKEGKDITWIDIIRIQSEFMVSYTEAIIRLDELNIISARQKDVLFGIKNDSTVTKLFKQMKADDQLLLKSKVTYVPKRFYEYLFSNYNNKYIPFSSLEKALSLLKVSAAEFNMDDTQNEDDASLSEPFNQ
jgi:Zn-dependent peptidase ImmA (M78 family)